jgi:hypothetical protein
MKFDEPFIDDEGNIIVIIRDDEGNIIGSNMTPKDSDA